MPPLLKDTVPFRGRRSMAMTAVGAELFFFGGVGARGTESILDVSDDRWCFETQYLKWRQIPNSGDWPNARTCTGICA